MRDGEGNLTEYSYDELGRQTSMKDALGRETSFLYDVLGRLLEETAPDGVKTSQEYDALNRITKETNGNGETLTYQYDYAGRVLAYTDGKGSTFGFSYDKNGRRTERREPDNTRQGYAYDGVGNLKEHTLADGTVASFEYDKNHQLTLQSWSDGTEPRGFAYDDVGRLVAAVQGDSTVTRAYDEAGRLLGENQELGDSEHAVSYDYNEDGQLANLTRPDDSSVSYGWNVRGQLETVNIDGPPPAVSYTYDKRGFPTKLTFETGVEETLSYDKAGQLLERTASKGNAVLTKASYGYDSAGQRTWLKRKDGSGDAFAYDKARQLIGAALDESNPQTANAAFSNDRKYDYDKAGNRTKTVEEGQSTSYKPNEVNAYVSIGNDRPSYDKNGNTLESRGLEMEWDAYQQLVSVYAKNPEEGSLRGDYVYDAFGRRIAREVFVWESNEWVFLKEERYIYDGWNVVYETSEEEGALEERCYTWGTDLSGTMQGAGGVGGLLVSERITEGEATQPYYHHYDGNGNTTALHGAGGALVAEYQYDPFGKVVSVFDDGSGVSEWNSWRFSTKKEDIESGFNYYGYRYYDALSGRWLSRDPIEENGLPDDSNEYEGIEFVQISNLYAFGPNNPVNGFDRDGEIWRLLLKKLGKLFKPKTGPGPRPKPKPKKPNTGDCSKAEQAALQAAVTAACKTGKRACNKSQDCPTLIANRAKNNACKAARQAINRRCYKGGDAGHRTAAQQAGKAAKKCHDIHSARVAAGKCTCK